MLSKENWMVFHGGLPAVIRNVLGPQAISDEGSAMLKYRFQPLFLKVFPLLTSEAESASESGSGQITE